VPLHEVYEQFARVPPMSENDTMTL
jgi:hypothetical protein